MDANGTDDTRADDDPRDDDATGMEHTATPHAAHDGAVPPLRATDDERRRVADELSEALGRGQIDVTEFDERTSRVWAARTRDELTGPLTDLVADPRAIIDGTTDSASAGAVSPYRPAAAPARGPFHDVAGPSSRDLAAVSKQHVTGEKGGSAFSAAVMFGADRNGDWLCPATHVSMAVMGGIDIDLRRARFESRHTEIVAVAIMGGIDILVPEDMRVSVEGTGIMGGFDSSRSRDVVIAGHDLPPDAPSVRITGVAIMGGVEVRRVPRRGGLELE
ncbi:DUF1707 SHOCT-like domain-containing protein [Corynebacterium freneyi]|uniref:DUF1707 SHOCT-like domain-containing protein n=1 Tax=Corynebacterium freneyi TaxID=134034 RepID=UPI001CD0008F|nr:DUF1707 domain-containing protein [Corynebacterium freneyi]UBI02654.1 DUF1707 domain-containing protein [Corynebacterium freneyi]